MSTLRQRVVTPEQWGKPDLNETGVPVCRWCRGAVKAPRRTFCGDACVHEWKIRSSPWYVRQQVKKRDKGVCRLCGFNVLKAHRGWTRAKPPAADRAVRKAWRALRPRWEADHIVPVADGGGECGLDNYRLLCRACHVSVTVTWRAQRAEKQSSAQREKQSSAPCAEKKERATAAENSGRKRTQTLPDTQPRTNTERHGKASSISQSSSVADTP